MSRRSEKNDQGDFTRELLIGLGETSVRKMYYPELQQRMGELELFRLLLDQAADAFFLVGSDGVIIDANSAARSYCLDNEQLVGCGIMEWLDMPVSLADLVKSGYSATLAQGGNFFLGHGDKRRPVELTAREVTLDEGVYLVIVARDISELVAAFAKISRQKEYLDTLRQISMGLLNRLELNDLLRNLIDRACQLFGTSDGYICLAGDDSCQLRMMVGTGRYSELTGRCFDNDQGLLGQVFRGKRQVIIENYPEWPGRSQNPLWEDLCSVIGLPLLSATEIFGVIGLDFYDGVRSFSHEEMVLLSQFAELASVAFVNARLHSELQESQEELLRRNEDLTAAHEELVASEEELRQNMAELLSKEEAVRRQNNVLNLLQEFSVGLMNELELDQLLKSIIERSSKLVVAGEAYIYLADEQLAFMEQALAVGKYNSKGYRVRVGEGVAGKVAQSGKAVFVEDYQSWPDRNVDSRWDTLKSCACVPLKVANKVIGAMGFDFFVEKHTFTAEEPELLERFGQLASIAIANARLYTAARQELAKRRQIQEALAISEEKFSKAFGHVADAIGIVRISDGIYIEVNDAYCKVLGFSKQDIIGHTSQEFNLWLRESERDYVYNKICTEGYVRNYEAHWRTKSGEIRVGVHDSDLIDIGGESCSVFVWHDITERKKAEEALRQKNEEIRRMAYTDALTGLPNRAAMNEWLAREMARVVAKEACGVFMFIDLDDLKLVNDTMGHTYGDAIIITAGKRIAAEAGEGAFVARVGGDEFIVAVSGRSDKAFGAGIAERILHALGSEQMIFDSRFHMSASVGIAAYPVDGDTVEELFKNADNAMYAAKKAGKNCWRFYEAAMQAETYEIVSLTNSLRYAIEREEFSLHYQPQVKADSSETVGLEALLRWRSAEHGTVPPNRFIPLAEQSGLIHQIGRWVLQEACKFALRLEAQGLGHISVAVNVSPYQLNADNFIDIVRSVLQDTGVNPRQIELEITENAFMLSIEEATRKLAKLNAMGIGASLDDFGVGYSSLTYLRHLPVKTLKIDRSFIEKLESDAVLAKMLPSIINMAHTLGMIVVAEGVETVEQLEYLIANSCDWIQGYLFCRPLPEEQALDYLGQSK